MTLRTERPHGTIGRNRFGPTGRDSKNGCHCQPCRRASRRSEIRRELHGPAYIDGTATAEHMLRCLAAGMTNHQIALLAALGDGGRTVIRHLLAKPGRKLRPDTARALLAVKPEPCRPVLGATCDATGCRRRVRALVANGWREADIAARLGFEAPALQLFRRARCESRYAIAIHDLYDELANIPGPSDAARARAKLHGWLGPLWWDEDTIDDPTAEPTGIREYDDKGRLLRDLTANRVDEVDRLTRQGLDRAQIVQRLGISRRQVRRDQDNAQSSQREAGVAVPAQPGPLVDDPVVDDVAIERAIAGETVALTRDERLEVARRMTAAGATPTDIAGVLRCNNDTIKKLLGQIQEAAA